MSIHIGEWAYIYENLGGGVYRIMGEHERQTDDGGYPFAGWREMGRVKSDGEENIKTAIIKAVHEGWPYVEKPHA